MDAWYDKERAALTLIRAQLAIAERPIVLCSFGKDSIVLLHLCLRIRKVPVLFFKFAKFHEKSAHALSVMQAWDLEAFDMWPTTVDDYQHEQFFEILHGYRTGPDHYIYLASGIRKRRDDDTRYLCAVSDLIGRPRSFDHTYPWDVTFLGQKGTDDIEFCQSAPIVNPVTPMGLTRGVVPFVDWTDEDIWRYIHRYDVPYDRSRYDQRNEATSPDKFPTCYHCLDSSLAGRLVLCPKHETLIPNIAKSPEDHEHFRRTVLNKLHYCEASGDARSTENVAHL